MKDCVIRNNKAVDVLQEIELFPPYARYFLDVKSSLLGDYRPFTLMVPEADR